MATPVAKLFAAPGCQEQSKQASRRALTSRGSYRKSLLSEEDGRLFSLLLFVVSRSSSSRRSKSNDDDDDVDGRQTDRSNSLVEFRIGLIALPSSAAAPVAATSIPIMFRPSALFISSRPAMRAVHSSRKRKLRIVPLNSAYCGWVVGRARTRPH